MRGEGKRENSSATLTQSGKKRERRERERGERGKERGRERQWGSKVPRLLMHSLAGGRRSLQSRWRRLGSRSSTRHC